MGGAYAIDSAKWLDNCVETGGMLSPVDPGEMSDVIVLKSYVLAPFVTLCLFGIFHAFVVVFWLS